ncbi:hypothetical protein KSS87_007980, partial [Heliosperma pusillum]
MLMLSGVGPATELMLHGIEVVVDQPQVGLGMSDNPMNAIFIPSPTGVETSLIQAVGITGHDSFIEAASGSTYTGAFMQNLPSAADMMSSQTGQTPKGDDMQRAIEFMHSVINGTFSGGVILEKIAGPRSSGYLHLTTLNPNDNPSVRFNYFQDPEDLEKCVKGIKTIISVIESGPFQRFRIPGMPIQALISMAVNLP